MKRKKSKSFLKTAACATGLVCAFSALSVFAGCSQNGASQENYIEISCGSGVNDADKPYDELYWRNDPVASGADPGVMWVSEEQDAENGGWYYAYVTDVRQTGNVVYSAFCYRSKDLSSWEVAGAADGYALVSVSDDWTISNFWAPECIYDETSGKYYLYYSAQRSEVARGDAAPLRITANCSLPWRFPIARRDLFRWCEAARISTARKSQMRRGLILPGISIFPNRSRRSTLPCLKMTTARCISRLRNTKILRGATAASGG